MRNQTSFMLPYNQNIAKNTILQENSNLSESKIRVNERADLVMNLGGKFGSQACMTF